MNKNYFDCPLALSISNTEEEKNTRRVNMGCVGDSRTKMRPMLTLLWKSFGARSCRIIRSKILFIDASLVLLPWYALIGATVLQGVRVKVSPRVVDLAARRIVQRAIHDLRWRSLSRCASSMASWVVSISVRALLSTRPARVTHQVRGTEVPSRNPRYQQDERKWIF